MASSIPTARTALITALRALNATTLSGVLVSRTGEWRDKGYTEAIFVENARDIDRVPQLGGRTYEERFTIPVRIVTTQGGDDLESVETRLWALVTIVEQTVIANSTLGAVLAYARPAGSEDGEQSGPFGDDNVSAELVLNVECEARPVLAA